MSEPTPPPAPKVGSCHALSWNDALAPTASNEGTSCEKSTALTFHVGTLGKDDDGIDRIMDVDGKGVLRLVLRPGVASDPV